MKKTVLLLGALAITFLTAKAQFTSTGFTHDFTSEYLVNGTDTLGIWGTDEAATNGGKPKYAFTKDVANGDLIVTLNQPKGSYSDMGFTFGAGKTIDLSANSTFEVEFENPGEEVIYASIFIIDENNNVIDHETVPTGTAFGEAWKYHLSCALDPQDVKKLPTPLSTGTGFINAHGTDIRGMFKSGAWLDYTVSQIKYTCDISKIKGVNITIRNGIQDTQDSYKPLPLVDYAVKIKKIKIGDYTLGGTTVAEDMMKQTIGVYPNPATNGVINFASVMENVKVYDTMGSLVKSFENAQQINVSDLTNGMYVLQTAEGHAKVFINN